MQTSPAHIVGVVLSGGRSSRMGGRDKALLPLAGRPLIAHVIERLKPQVADIAINANGEGYAGFGLPVTADAVGGFAGPLAGIHAGLAWTKANRPEASHVVTVPADTPFFPRDLVSRFLAALPADPRIIVACTDEGLHPVVGLWPLSAAEAIADALARDFHKASAFVKQQGAIEVAFPPEKIGGREIDPFFNINRPEDLAEAEEILRASARLGSSAGSC